MRAGSAWGRWTQQYRCSFLGWLIFIKGRKVVGIWWFPTDITDCTDLDTYSIFEGGHADFADDADFTELNLRGPGFYRVCTPFLKKNWLSVEGRMNSCYFCIGGNKF